jgi:hypothetical protein
MPARTDADSKRETWQDWLPADEPEPNPDDLLTRGQLVERLQEQGADITVKDLTNWHGRGVLPRGVRHRIGSVTYVLYPPQFIAMVRRLLDLQDEGLTLREIGPQLRVEFFGKALTANKVSVPIRSDVSARASVRRGDHALTANDDVARLLRDIARDHEARYGGSIMRVELRLIDEFNNPLTLAVDTK